MNEEFFERNDADIVRAARKDVRRMISTGEAAHVDPHYLGDILRCELAFLQSYHALLGAYEEFNVQVKLDKSGQVQDLLEELHIQRDIASAQPQGSCFGSPIETALLGAMREVSPDFVETSIASSAKGAYFAGIQDLTIALKAFAKKHDVGIKVKIAK